MTLLVGSQKKSLSISVPPEQAIKAGWRLLIGGILAKVRRQDLWLSATFTEK